ncbi:MAG: hypothetical protein JO205_01480, partial [Pseudolabrys sp.]|nr:hypothetical protein [Pseudolabrys sp.]
MMILYPLLLSTQLVLVGDTVPQFDASRGCPASATEALLNRTVEACQIDENNAKKTLSEGWSKFAAGDRASCQRMVSMG